MGRDGENKFKFKKIEMGTIGSDIRNNSNSGYFKNS